MSNSENGMLPASSQSGGEELTISILVSAGGPSTGRSSISNAAFITLKLPNKKIEMAELLGDKAEQQSSRHAEQSRTDATGTQGNNGDALDLDSSSVDSSDDDNVNPDIIASPNANTHANITATLALWRAVYVQQMRAPNLPVEDHGSHYPVSVHPTRLVIQQTTERARMRSTIRGIKHQIKAEKEALNKQRRGGIPRLEESEPMHLMRLRARLNHAEEKMVGLEVDLARTQEILRSYERMTQINTEYERA